MHLLFLLLFSLITNEGPFMDPNGGRAAVRGRHVRALDNGDGRSIIDPIGHAAGDSGGGMDPNG